MFVLCLDGCRRSSGLVDGVARQFPAVRVPGHADPDERDGGDDDDVERQRQPGPVGAQQPRKEQWCDGTAEDTTDGVSHGASGVAQPGAELFGHKCCLGAVHQGVAEQPEDHGQHDAEITGCHQWEEHERIDDG